MADEPRDYNGYDARITALEVGVKSIGITIHDLKGDVDTKLEHIVTIVNGVRGDLLDQGKTQWPTYFGGLAVVLVIVGMVGSGYVRDQERTEGSVQVLNKKFQAHDASPEIHFSLRERVLHNVKQIEDNLKTHDVDLHDLDSQVRNIHKWQEKHAERASQSHAIAHEKIQSLEKYIDRWADKLEANGANH